MSKNNNNGWDLSINAYTNPKVLGMMFLGFSAGLPYMLVFSNISAWLTDIRVPLYIVGFFAWISITFSIKIFWAPVIDVINIPFLTKWLGHRRSWMLLAQVGIVCGLIGLSSVDPHSDIWLLAWFGFLTAFFAATQDICVDAYRIEAVKTKYQAAMASTYIFGYRFAIVISGAGALMISEFSTWNNAYFVMACLMGVGMITTLIISEPINRSAMKSMPVELVKEHINSFEPDVRKTLKVILTVFSIVFSLIALVLIVIFPIFIPLLLIAAYRFRNQNIKEKLTTWYLGTVVGPIVDFIYRYTFRMSMLILTLILIYKISDLCMAYMANPLYLHVGFTKLDIAVYTKVFGVVMTLVGAFIGGVLVMRHGVMKIMLLGAILVASTNLLFTALALTGKSIPMLIFLIIGDNFSNGVASVAFIAYMSSLVNKQYTATQYALFTSLMLFVGKFMQGFSGSVVAFVGYPTFFVIAALTGIPTILLILYLMKLKHDPSPSIETNENQDADDKQNSEGKPASKTSKGKLIGALIAIPALIGVLAVFVLFERGVFQFNNPDQATFQVRGITVSGSKTIKWKQLNLYTWDIAKKKNLDYIYFEVTKGAEEKRDDKQEKKYQKFTKKYQANWKNAQLNNYRVGAAHTFNLCQKGKLQAENVINNVPKTGKALALVIQIELVANCPIQEQPSSEKIAIQLKILSKKLTNHYGKQPILMGTEVAYKVLVNKYLPNSRFWIKSIIKTPVISDQQKWKHWQYSRRGVINGVGNAKLNAFKGKRSELR